VKYIIAVILALLLAAALCGCANEPPPEPPAQPAQPEPPAQPVQPEPPAQPVQPEPPAQPEQPPEPVRIEEPAQPEELAASGEVTVSFDYAKQSGSASNQFAIWIEDTDGNYVKTLYATRYTANGGYERRPDSIPIWVEKSGVDAVTSATPKAGPLSFDWDLTDKDGNTVPKGEYKILVEGTLRWKNQVLYSGVIDLAGEAAAIALTPEFTFAGADNQPALTPEAPEAAMITSVRAEYAP
jgi:hypothetical protein